MKKERMNVVTCPPCGERACPRRFLSGVALATKRGAYKAISLMSPSIGPADHFLRKGGRLAFTLIELLVVVLIIGILAAVAVPQYQKAVYKSRYAMLKNLSESIGKAEIVYYLANGAYTEDLEKLDVELSGGALDDSTPKKYVWDWGYCKARLDGNDDLKLGISCVNENIGMGYVQAVTPTQTRKSCYVYGSVKEQDFPLQSQICKSETGLSYRTGTGDNASPQYFRYQY